MINYGVTARMTRLYFNDNFVREGARAWRKEEPSVVWAVIDENTNALLLGRHAKNYVLVSEEVQ